MRDEIAKIIREKPEYCDICESYVCDCMESWMISAVDQILALVNKPIEVRLKCERCGGSGDIPKTYMGMNVMGFHSTSGEKYQKTSPCTCDNGERVHRVMWEWQSCEAGKGVLDNSKPLTPTDLVGPDVRRALVELDKRLDARFFNQLSIELPHNKGTLRLQEVA
jgi:hypothetical protein